MQPKQILYRFIFFRLMGWRIRGNFDPEIRKSVLMIIPHTSWMDFVIGLFARGIIGLEMNYVAKKELFKPPFGWWFRWMGGAPLDRSGSLNTVDAIVRVFESRKIFRMAIASEGTRKRVSELKTGFYFIALKANVPIIPVAFDYKAKEVRIGNAFYPCGNYPDDLKKLAVNFNGAQGRFADQGYQF